MTTPTVLSPASSMLAVTAYLTEVTGTEWGFHNTGGGCMAIETFLRPEGSVDANGDGDDPHVMITSTEGPLSADDDVEEVERYGWMIGVYQCWTDDEPTMFEAADTTALAEQAKAAIALMGTFK